MASFATLHCEQITQPGLEPLRESTGELVDSENGGTPGGTLEADEDLWSIIEAWQVLSELERRAIPQMVEAASAGGKLS